MCDAAFIHPAAAGSHAAVLIWLDALGLRPTMREMAKRLAAEGYSVLVPNLFYRVAKAPVFGDVTKISFQDPEFQAKLKPLAGSINAPGAADSDTLKPISRSSTRNRKSTRRRKSGRKATAWVDLSW